MYFWLRLRLRNIPLTSGIVGKNGNLNREQYISTFARLGIYETTSSNGDRVINFLRLHFALRLWKPILTNKPASTRRLSTTIRLPISGDLYGENEVVISQLLGEHFADNGRREEEQRDC
jgi:hypothetical protein